jgi:hypothetical protein
MPITVETTPISNAALLRRRLWDADPEGLTVVAHGEVECRWSYVEVSHAVRGLMGSAGGTGAIEDAGADAGRNGRA